MECGYSWFRYGERLSVPKEIKNIMRDTGTAHLMAISGLHIAFAALLAAGLIRGGQVYLHRRWIHWQMPLVVESAVLLFMHG